jgi:hypothetical protein
MFFYCLVVPGAFVDGDMLTYTSILSTSDSSWTAADLPRGLQFVITGMNVNREIVVNSFIITYSNDCDIFPVLTVGQQGGWVDFVRIVKRF